MITFTTICDIPGTGTRENQANAIECDDCPIGRFNNNHNKGICKQCPQGLFAKEKKSKQCVKCPGNPPCAGRGDCDNKIGACINCKDGWTGKACEICTSPWLKFNGECTSCEPEYDKIKWRNDSKQFKAWCDGKMSAYKIPKALKIFDALPRNAMGKVIKPALHELI